MGELDLTAAESKATYEEIKDYVLKQSGLKVSNLYIAQVKQKCGIIERANYNLPKSENSRQPKCPPEKEAPEENFDGCLPQKVCGSAPVPKRNGPVGTVHGGKNGGIGCIAGQKRTDFPSVLPVNGNPAYQGLPSTDPSSSGSSVQSWLFRWECMAGSN